MDNCIFCKIVRGEVPAKIILDSDETLAFYDVDPKAPVHILIIPKAHIGSIMEAGGENAGAFEAMGRVARELAVKLGLNESGFRIIVNTGRDGGQTVQHLHMHLLGGRSLEWPPG